ncbi:MAG: glycosyltransferase family 2 protein [Burkholderiaceae bacterium]|nr:glycosyltransferase family 2 protein [Burkholderiaceae bacterium]
MKISIALATYNGAQYLKEQLDSFTAQKRLPDELVICDDGSTDETIEILERFKIVSPFTVRIFKNIENLGHERNFGKAIDLCEGDIIFLSDQDDSWLPSKLASVEDVFEKKKGVLLVINDAEITDGTMLPTGRTVFGQTMAAGVIGDKGKSLTLGCATAFRSELRSLVSPIPSLDYGHDSWIHDFTHMIGGRYVLEKTLQFYRRHGKNVSNWAFDGSARATMQSVVKPSLGQDLRPAYEKRIATLDLMIIRLNSLGAVAYAELGVLRPFLDVLSELDHAKNALNRRKLMFEYGWFGRKIVAINMWLRGEYRYFLGWKSLAKDLLR